MVPLLHLPAGVSVMGKVFIYLYKLGDEDRFFMVCIHINGIPYNRYTIL